MDQLIILLKAGIPLKSALKILTRHSHHQSIQNFADDLDQGRSLVSAARHFFQHDPKHNFYILGFLDSENKSAISFNDLKPYIDYYNVTYLEPTDDVSSILCDFDCVVFPSYYFEGVPRCLIEAASCGLPIITNNSRGCREVVDEGFNGFLCEPKNINSLISKTNQFINLSFKSRLQMGKNSRQKALNNFDEEIVLNSYVNILKSHEYL